jgi:hypothetical protein
MKHYSNEEWGDFANGTVSPLQKQAMLEHLNSKCEKCNALASVWQKIQRAAAQEHLFQPPADIVHLVKSEFANSGYGKEPGLLGALAELIFDSAQKQALAGVRSVGAQSRQMLFHSNPFQIEVKIESKVGEPRLSVTGQLMDVSKPDSIGKGVLMTLSNRRGQTIQTTTNDFGEFHAEIENRGDLEITFLAPDGKPIVVSVRDALAYPPSHVRGVKQDPQA